MGFHSGRRLARHSGMQSVRPSEGRWGLHSPMSSGQQLAKSSERRLDSH